MTFKEFITRKYWQWQLDTGQKKTVEEFGKLFGISKQLMSAWMNGGRHPGAKHKKTIIEMYGDEAAEALDEDPRLFFINENWEYASEELQRSITDQLREHISKNESKRTHSQRKKTVT